MCHLFYIILRKEKKKQKKFMHHDYDQDLTVCLMQCKVMHIKMFPLNFLTLT